MLLKERIEKRIKVMGRLGRRCKQLLDCLQGKEMIPEIKKGSISTLCGELTSE
jgi:hypothetical protein